MLNGECFTTEPNNTEEAKFDNLATEGIEASRIFLSGETAIDTSTKTSLARFDLTD